MATLRHCLSGSHNDVCVLTLCRQVLGTLVGAVELEEERRLRVQCQSLLSVAKNLFSHLGTCLSCFYYIPPSLHVRLARTYYYGGCVAWDRAFEETITKGTVLSLTLFMSIINRRCG